MIKRIWTWLASHWPWWLRWMGPGTDDDRRNFGWRITEYLAPGVIWALTILDLRIFTVREKKFLGLTHFWPIYLWGFYRTKENFWNGFFTVQIYIVRWKWRRELLYILAAITLPLDILTLWFGPSPWLVIPAAYYTFALYAWPSIHFVFRPCHQFYLLLAEPPSPLFDRNGEFHNKISPMLWSKEGGPRGWEEGNI